MKSQLSGSALARHRPIELQFGHGGLILWHRKPRCPGCPMRLLERQRAFSGGVKNSGRIGLRRAYQSACGIFHADELYLGIAAHDRSEEHTSELQSPYVI